MGDFLHYFRLAKNVVELAPGERLFSQGDIGDFMYGVLEGQLSLHIGDREVDRVGPGGLIGEMALVDASPRSTTVVALTPSRLAQVDQRQFLYMVHESPNFALDVMRELSARLRQWHAGVGHP